MTAPVVHPWTYPGKPLPLDIREYIIELYGDGETLSEIGRLLQVPRLIVGGIVNHFRIYGTCQALSSGGKDPEVITDDVLKVIEIWKLRKTTIYAIEIQNRLLRENICVAQNVLSLRSIQRAIRNNLNMTRKKVTCVPLEYNTPENMLKVDQYLDVVSRLDSKSLHFFDESSVIKTSSNRKYGSSYRGAPAIELQRFASNANYTINLCHSAIGIDYFNVIPGPSNGNELISFFENAIDAQRDDGTFVFHDNDTPIMDNCGFHHGRFTERIVRDILAERNTRLMFQPPYSPHLNTCEYCFRIIKEYLRQNQVYAMNETEMAILDAMDNVTIEKSCHIFHHCGYFI